MSHVPVVGWPPGCSMLSMVGAGGVAPVVEASAVAASALPSVLKGRRRADRGRRPRIVVVT